MNDYLYDMHLGNGDLYHGCVDGFWGNGTRIPEFLFFHVFPLANPPYARWGVEHVYLLPALSTRVVVPPP